MKNKLLNQGSVGSKKLFDDELDYFDADANFWIDSAEKERRSRIIDETKEEHRKECETVYVDYFSKNLPEDKADDIHEKIRIASEMFFNKEQKDKNSAPDEMDRMYREHADNFQQKCDIQVICM